MIEQLGAMIAMLWEWLGSHGFQFSAEMYVTFKQVIIIGLLASLVGALVSGIFAHNKD